MSSFKQKKGQIFASYSLLNVSVNVQTSNNDQTINYFKKLLGAALFTFYVVLCAFSAPKFHLLWTVLGSVLRKHIRKLKW